MKISLVRYRYQRFFKKGSVINVSYQVRLILGAAAMDEDPILKADRPRVHSVCCSADAVERMLVSTVC